MNQYQYQKDAVKFLERTRNALLQLDTGLGKTKVYLDYAAKKNKTLIICPAFLRGNTLEELRKWHPELPSLVPRHFSHVSTNADQCVQIVSYNFVTDMKNLHALMQNTFDVVIYDESHYVRRWNSARTQHAVKLLRCKAKSVVFSTATPQIQGAADLHPMLTSIQPGKWGKFSEFAEKFGYKRYDPYTRDIKYYGVRVEHAEELEDRLAQITFKRSKEEVGVQIPPKIRTNIVIPYEEHPEDDFKDIDRALKDVERAQETGEESECLEVMRRQAGFKKIPTVVELANNILLNPAEKVVIFAWNREVAASIAHQLNGGLIHGGISEKQRAIAKDSFQNGTLRVIVLTCGAGGAGYTLTAASILLFVQVPYSYSEVKQCEDRVHRIGQTKTTMIYHIKDNILDPALYRIFNRKADDSKLTGTFIE